MEQEAEQERFYPKNKKSIIWEYMHLQKVNNKLNKKWVFCNLCTSRVSYHGCTTNGISHLLKIHNLGKIIDFNQPGIKEAMAKVPTNPLDPARQHEISLLLGRMIVMDLLSYNVVNRAGFKSFITSLEPRFKMPSINYIANDIIPELYQLERV